ncbi:MAG: hypothetical protein OXR03_12460 [Rhodospirillaceae bacterium]|nr:hypothetical protein [Rhodospirillaceae bacterium]MDD9926630.1 hypothetical protein [Rhodospirillaceae bacterium]
MPQRKNNDGAYDCGHYEYPDPFELLLPNRRDPVGPLKDKGYKV